MRNHGFADYDEVGHVGTNGKMSEVAAAMGLTSLESLRRVRRGQPTQLRGLSCRAARGLRACELIAYDDAELCNWQYVVLEVDESAALTRDELHAVLWAENVLARRYFFPGCHRMEPYRSLFPDVAERLPQTERLVQRVLALPTGTSMTVDEREPRRRPGRAGDG